MAIVPHPKRSGEEKRQERLNIREKLWPGSSAWVWDYKADKETIKGFSTIPRLLPLIMGLIRILANSKPKGGDPGMVYLELWSRTDSEAIIQKTDIEDAAYCAGYTGERALRTWSDHMDKLVAMGFVMVKPEGNRKYANILLINPLAVCARLRAENQVPEAWWALFERMADKMGATIPDPSVLPPNP